MQTVILIVFCGIGLFRLGTAVVYKISIAFYGEMW